MERLFLIIAIVLACGCRAPVADQKLPLSDQTDEFHHVIRETEMAEQPTAIGRQWEEVRARFVQAGYKEISARDNQHTTDHTYLIRGAAWSSPLGEPYDLTLEVTVDKRDPHETPSARPNEVMEVAAGLVGKPSRTFDSLAGKGIYSRESSLGQCFATAEFQGDLKKYPIVKEVEVTYDLIRDRWSETVPWGFHVRLELGKRLDNDDTGMQLFFTVESGLDPAQDWDGRPLPKEKRQVLGGVRFWGSNEWRPS